MTEQKYTIYAQSQMWLNEFDGLYREQTKGGDSRPVKLVAYKNQLLNVHEFLKVKLEESKNPSLILEGEVIKADTPPAPLKTRASKRWSLDKLNEIYGFKAEEVWDEKGNYTPHPSFVKHKKPAGIIDAVYALQESEQITISKAKELVTAIIEKHFQELINEQHKYQTQKIDG